MNHKNLPYLLILFLLLNSTSFSQSNSFQYVSPKPNSKLHSRTTNIIFEHKSEIDAFSLSSSDLLTVIGSISGVHDGEIILTNDNKTIVFKSFVPFSAGETVNVILAQGIRTLDSEDIDSISFKFEISPLEQPILLDPVERLKTGYTVDDIIDFKINFDSPVLDSIPPDFPEITVSNVNNPSPGNIFLSNARFGQTDTSGFFLMILDNAGTPVKYKRVSPIAAFDFKVQKNGQLSYADIFEFTGSYSLGQFKILDTNLTVIDSVRCGNGYQADLHDFLILPNGHYLLMAYDPQPVDMSELIAGGDPNAIVVGGIIQELDQNKNVIFQWRSWDHIPITDAYGNLLQSTIDYIHLNAFDLDDDGNVLFIGRTLSEVTKISRATGDVIWRLGGKQNQFTFINEHPENAPTYFAGPHNIRRIDNGNITLFDNGDFHDPPYSRAVEYELDEQNKTATLVWEYFKDPKIYSLAMGSMQRLENENSLIGWGFASVQGEPVLTEVHPDGTIALELFFPLDLASYRAFKFPWASGLPSDEVSISEVLEGNTYTFNNNSDTTGLRIKFNQLTSILYNAVTVKKYNYAPENPEFTSIPPFVFPSRVAIEVLGITSLEVDIWFDLDQYPEISDPQNVTVYHRPTVGSGTFIPLNTSYNSGTNELLITAITEVGEFIFGIADVQVIPTIPELVYPENGEKVNQNNSLGMQWSPQGFANKFYLQIATDAAFNNLIVDDSTLTEPTYILASLLQEQNYYWRAKSKNSAGWGGWSEEWNFESTAPFLELLFPNGGEIWKTDTSMAINWDSNLIDSVRIELYSDESFFSFITDSLFSVLGGYRWFALDSIPDGSNYKIRVTTIDGSFVDISENNFTIIYIPVSVQQIDEVVSDFKLEQNYPNPFNPMTTINYSLPIQSNVNIKIYNVVGELFSELVNEMQGAGNYKVTWDASYIASGIYFYSIEAVPSDGSDMFRSVKKMILLK